MTKRIFLVRIIFLFIIPIIFSLIIFNPWEKIPMDKIKKGNDTFVVISQEYFLRPTIRNAFADLFRVPFDFDVYKICFEDKGTYVTYADNTQEKVAGWSVIIDNETILNISQQNKPFCVLRKINQETLYNWEANFPLVLKYKYFISQEIYGRPYFVFSPDTTSYAVREPKSLFVSMMLFFISWLSLMWLISRIGVLVREGFNFLPPKSST